MDKPNLQGPCKHIHRFVRKVIGTRKTSRFQCSDPFCYATHGPNFLVGKYSRCNSCDEPFILDWEQLTDRKYPKCMSCRDTKRSRHLKDLQEMLDSLSEQRDDVDFEKGLL